VHSKFVNIAFESRMEIEDIFGTTHTIKGFLRLDKRGNAKKFRLEVPVASLRTGIKMRDDHLRSEIWLDAARHPSIVFEGSSLRHLGKGRYQVTGQFTMRGRSKQLKAVVTARRISPASASKLGLGNAEWVRVRGAFKLRLSDFGVRIPKMAAAKVNDLWSVKISLFAKRTES
jgi:polyisoprenoid-binding protein YceI